MQYLGIDWGTRRAAWCALTTSRRAAARAMISADEDGLARLVARLGPDVYGCIEMMSGAAWVREQLAACGWRSRSPTRARSRRSRRWPARPTSVDARVLADLARRDLVPTVWVPSLDDRAIRERLRRRAHLIRLRTSAINRTFGLLRRSGACGATSPRCASPARSTSSPSTASRRSGCSRSRTLLGVIDDLDRQLAPLERELRPLARSDERARLLMTIPGVAELLALTLAAEIGDIARFPSAAQARRLLRPGAERSSSPARARAPAGSPRPAPTTLRWAAVEASQHAWRPTTPGTASTPTSSAATARPTPPSPPSRARS